MYEYTSTCVFEYSCVRVHVYICVCMCAFVCMNIFMLALFKNYDLPFVFYKQCTKGKRI